MSSLTHLLTEAKTTISRKEPGKVIYHQGPNQFQEVEKDSLSAILRKILNPDTYEKVLSFNIFSKSGRMNVKPLQLFGGRRERENAIQKAILSFLDEHKPDGHPRVMVIGDSIRMRYLGEGYGPVLYDMMAGECEFVHIPHNTSRSPNAPLFIDNWLSSNPDLVLFNAGLHDVVRRGLDAPCATSEIEYKQNIRIVAEKARERGVRLALMTSTPVWEEVINSEDRQKERRDKGRELRYRFNSDVQHYNEILRSVAHDYCLDVVDLYSVVLENDLQKCISSRDGVHLTKHGENICAEALEDYISRSI